MGYSKRRKQEEWAALLASQEQSNQRVSAFCELHGINPGTFYYWRSKLQVPPAKEPGFVALHPKGQRMGVILVRCRIDIELKLPGDY